MKKAKGGGGLPVEDRQPDRREKFEEYLWDSYFWGTLDHAREENRGGNVGAVFHLNSPERKWTAEDSTLDKYYIRREISLDGRGRDGRRDHPYGLLPPASADQVTASFNLPFTSQRC